MKNKYFEDEDIYFNGSSNIDMGKIWYESIIFSFCYAFFSTLLVC